MAIDPRLAAKGDRMLGQALRWLQRLDDWLMINSARVGGWTFSAAIIVVLVDWYRWGFWFAVHVAIVFAMGLAVVLLGWFDPPRR
jgi:hypothetical protein